MDIHETYLKIKFTGVNGLSKLLRSQFTNSGNVLATSAYYHLKKQSLFGHPENNLSLRLGGRGGRRRTRN